MYLLVGNVENVLVEAALVFEEILVGKERIFLFVQAGLYFQDSFDKFQFKQVLDSNVLPFQAGMRRRV